MIQTVQSETRVKLEQLRKYLKNVGVGVVAYSGGVDSTFLLKIAYEVLGKKCLAVIAVSETYPKVEQNEALETVKGIGAPHLLIVTHELDNEQFAENPQERCYFCKSELFKKLFAIAKERQLHYVFDGANADDLKDYRPGTKAGRELGVLSPLQEVGLTKEEIRLLSREMGLPTWNKPSLACLSSRFPYGHRITLEKLQQVDQAENFMRGLGFRQLRVRHHENTARIELPTEDFSRVTGLVLEKVVSEFKAIGFTYITLDLQGFRSGSMNEVLHK